MDKIKDLTVEDLEHLIEQKMLEFLGDPDSGLEMRKEFKMELNRRLKNPGPGISQHEVGKKFG